MTGGNEHGEETATVARCAGCNRVFQVGDHYITDTSSGFAKAESDPVVDDLISGIFGGSDGMVRFCEDCTEPGGDYLFETFYGDEAVRG